MDKQTIFTDKDYPGLLQAADAASITSQKLYFRLLFCHLSLLILGALISLFAGCSTLYALLAAIVFLSSLFMSILIAFKRYDHTWYSTRAIAESVKTRSWRYMMQSVPYEDTIPKHDSKETFLSDLKQILQQNQDVTGEFTDKSVTIDAITEQMENVRNSSLKERVDFYKHHRVENQRDWYNRKALLNKRLGRIWFIAMVVLQALAVLCALVRIAYPDWQYLPAAVFATAAASVTSWAQAKRFNELNTSYSLASYEISFIKTRIENTVFNTENAFSSFVNDTENAFSREHTQWAARRNV